MERQSARHPEVASSSWLRPLAVARPAWAFLAVPEPWSAVVPSSRRQAVPSEGSTGEAPAAEGPQREGVAGRPVSEAEVLQREAAAARSASAVEVLRPAVARPASAAEVLRPAVVEARPVSAAGVLRPAVPAEPLASVERQQGAAQPARGGGAGRPRGAVPFAAGACCCWRWG